MYVCMYACLHARRYVGICDFWVFTYIVYTHIDAHMCACVHTLAAASSMYASLWCIGGAFPPKLSKRASGTAGIKKLTDDS